MKKFIQKIKNRCQRAAVAVQTAIVTKKAEGYVDSGVKILIAVVIGALLLAGLYTLFNTNIIPTLTTKINGLFNYKG
ncbi:MAG: hypothetical protein BWY46_01861 [Firmicutes bacterium ADurb.Bin300]|nr:MAG: hypothetical protein BWY46_01861 [Firmicutes bacterium ADurb.Bin300]